MKCKKNRAIAFILIFSLLFCSVSIVIPLKSSAAPPLPAPINAVFTDAGLAEVIRVMLGFANVTDDVNTADLISITSLSAPNKNISNLSGIETLTNVTSIDLSSNHISALSNTTFSANTLLTSLNLNSNQIASLPAGVFSANPSLQTLSMSRNKLASLPLGIFDSNSALTSLDLSYNHIFDYSPLLTASLALSSGSFDNQTLILPSQALNIGALTVANPARNVDGTSIVPSSISNSGVHVAPNIAWMGLSGNGDANFTYASTILGRSFSGTILLPYTDPSPTPTPTPTPPPAPVISAVIPNGSSVLTSASSLVILFNQSMSTATTGVVTIDKGAIITSPVWSNTDYMLTYMLGSLKPSTTYTVYISGFKNLVGGTLAPYTHTFTTSSTSATPATYRITQAPSSNNQYTAISNGSHRNFVGASIDSVHVNATDYTMWEGSTYVRFSQTYLNTLSIGSHSLRLHFTDGDAVGTFTSSPLGGSVLDYYTLSPKPSSTPTPYTPKALTSPTPTPPPLIVINSPSASPNVSINNENMGEGTPTQPITGTNSVAALLISVLILVAGGGITFYVSRRNSRRR